jgi:hypothetical protein
MFVYDQSNMACKFVFNHPNLSYTFECNQNYVTDMSVCKQNNVAFLFVSNLNNMACIIAKTYWHSNTHTSKYIFCNLLRNTCSILKIQQQEMFKHNFVIEPDPRAKIFPRIFSLRCY